MGNKVNVDDEKATAESFTHNCKIKAGMMSKGKVTGNLKVVKSQEISKAYG